MRHRAYLCKDVVAGITGEVMAVTKEEILNFWVSIHGALSPQQREEFLARNELAYLMTHTDGDVAACIRKRKKLRDIVACLRDERDTTNPSPSRNPRTSTPKSSPTFTGSRPQTRSGRSLTRGEVWDRPVPYGTTDPRYK